MHEARRRPFPAALNLVMNMMNSLTSSVMQRVERMSVAARLRSGFGFLMVLVVAMAVCGAVAMFSITRHMTHIVEVNNARKDLANDLLNVIGGLAIHARNVTLMTDMSDIKRELAAFEKSVAEHDKVQARLADALAGEPEKSRSRQLMGEIRTASAKTLPNVKRAVKAGNEGSNVEATMILTTEVQKDETVWRAKVEEMLDLQLAESAAAVAAARVAQITALLFGGLLMVGALVSGGFVSRWVVRNNTQMMNVIEEQNANLERRVEERTAQLQQKTNDINAMLQNMALGVCTVVPGNMIHPEYSNYLSTFARIDKLADQDLMTTVFARATFSADVRDQVATALGSMLGEDEMMFEFNSHLLPSEIDLEDADGSRRVAQLQWSPIVNQGGTVEKVLMIVQDVTHLRALELQARQQRMELDTIAKVLKVPAGKFNEFVATGKRLTAESRHLISVTPERSDAAIAALFRNLHTVKGNARTFDFNLVSDPAHAAESTYDRLRKDASVAWDVSTLLAELAAVDAGLDEYSRVNDEKLGRGGRAADFVSGRGAFVATDDLGELKATAVELLADSQDPQARRLLTMVEGIGMASLQRIMSGATDAVQALAAQLGKPTPRIDLIGGSIGFTPEFAEALKASLIHIVRNSLDHGIEDPATRQAAGKPAAGTLKVECLRSGQGSTLSVRDDGRGLNLPHILNKARANGLVAEGVTPSRAEIAELIFHSGLSTAQNLTEVSGRGVGMDAVRSFLAGVGANVSVRLTQEEGAPDLAAFSLVITVPASVATPNRFSDSAGATINPAPQAT